VQAGIAPQRLVFTGLLPPAEYLARYRSADLFLDTLPYNAGTTASDALRMGLPLLTCTGDAFAGRMAASLLNAMDVPDLITSTQAGYEALAVELATDAARLQLVKARLQRNRVNAALFDTAGFARHLEAAFSKAFERHQAGMRPDHIVEEAQDVAKA
jgi:protein O-GlcNAc transferase